MFYSFQNSACLHWIFPTGFEHTTLQYDAVPRYTLNKDSEKVAVVSLVPIVFGWLLAYALVYLARWIRAGFAKQ